MTDSPESGPGAAVGSLSTLTDAGWPALVRLDLGDGWQARFADGVTKRANSAWATAPGATLLSDTVTRAEETYRGRGLAPVFQLSTADAAAMPRLIGRGYRAIDETLVMTAAVNTETGVDAALEASGAITLADAPTTDWLALWWSVDGRGGDHELEIARRILTGVPALYASAHAADGSVAAVARLALVGSWGGVFCVATAPERRRAGHAGRAIRGLLAEGARQGVTAAWLQVLASNAAASALYARLGFAEAERYRYLVGRHRPLPAAHCR